MMTSLLAERLIASVSYGDDLFVSRLAGTCVRSAGLGDPSERREFIQTVFLPLLGILGIDYNNKLPFIALREISHDLCRFLSAEEKIFVLDKVLSTVCTGFSELGDASHAFSCIATYVDNMNANELQNHLERLQRLCFAALCDSEIAARVGALEVWRSILPKMPEKGVVRNLNPILIAIVTRLAKYDSSKDVIASAHNLLQMIEAQPIVPNSGLVNPSVLTGSMIKQHNELFESNPGASTTSSCSIADRELLSLDTENESEDKEEIEFFLRGSIQQPVQQGLIADFQEPTLFEKNLLNTIKSALQRQLVYKMDNEELACIQTAVRNSILGFKPEELSKQLVLQRTACIYLESLYERLTSQAIEHLNQASISRELNLDQQADGLKKLVIRQADELENQFTEFVVPVLEPVLQSCLPDSTTTTGPLDKKV